MKTILILASLVCLGLVAGCGNNTVGDNPDRPKDAPTTDAPMTRMPAETK